MACTVQRSLRDLVPKPDYTFLGSTQGRTAVSGDDGIPEDWGGRGSDLHEGAEAVRHCGLDAGTGCAGLTAMALRTLENHQTLEELQVSVDGRTVYIKVYSFDSPESATVTAKAMTAAGREDAQDSKPLQTETGAEYTDALSEEISEDDYSAKVVLRTGAVVITAWGTDLKGTADMQEIAKGRVDRVLKVAAVRVPTREPPRATRGDRWARVPRYAACRSRCGSRSSVCRRFHGISDHPGTPSVAVRRGHPARSCSTGQHAKAVMLATYGRFERPQAAWGPW
ncbi:hypothetical protein OG698_01950 [Streptomyces sp. NBC_01003]|uniref:hypothetical protein n=1 Tax=Streptomyces sp. NBC_01003 TaxID=2903714 RepID=UPI0038661135|nr:hypothetical protein OG698_01950 [Streptomyces sp. NBC_01003]